MTTRSFSVRKTYARAWLPALLVAVGAIVACSSKSADGTSSSSHDGGSSPPASTSDAAKSDASSHPSVGDDGGGTVPIDTDAAAMTGLGAATFAAGDLDAPSDGGTITFQQIGGAGWYPSLRDPSSGDCGAYSSGTCCLATDTITSDELTPWDEELIMTLRGPMDVKQLAVYQPNGDTWNLVSGWDSRHPTTSGGTAFSGDATPMTSFAGGVGSECLVNVATDRPFPCGPGSSPYCPTGASTSTYGWAGSKIIVILAKMAHAGTTGAPTACSTTDTGNWYDAPWIGLAVGELARAGSFASCQCFAKDPSMWALANGCGQFNVFEVVNDNDSSKNLDVFSTDLIDYSGYVGQGPCGSGCNAATLGPGVDLIDKTNDTEATAGAVATPAGGPTAAFRRPEEGYRYFFIQLDVPSRTVQLGLVHPQKIPSALSSIVPSLPSTFPASAAKALLDTRLPT